MKYVVWILVALLIVLHQDVWYWNDDSLLLGFLPIGMAWHVGISIAASLVWLMAIQFAWPIDETAADEGDAA